MNLRFIVHGSESVNIGKPANPKYKPQNTIASKFILAHQILIKHPPARAQPRAKS
jgi:hypothetical protein